MKILGDLFGVELGKQADGRTEFTLLMEDDEIWHRLEDTTAELFWIDDLIEVLQKVKAAQKTD